MTATLLHGNCLDLLPTLEAGSVRCCVTSPPYWGLRDYGVAGQFGLEATPEQYVENMVRVFREVRRVLADDGTLWLNLGDSYAAGGKGGGGSYMAERGESAWQMQSQLNGWRSAPAGMKSKDLVGIPWMVAFALRADGWYLRSDVIWSKPNPMPESVTDRPTKSHEYLFLLSKSPRYYYNADAIAEPLADSSVERLSQPNLANQRGSDRVPGKTNGNMKAVMKQDGHGRRHAGLNERWDAAVEENGVPPTRNARSVWTIPTQPYSGAHFATFPEELARRCILAGSAPGDTVLDPFGGSGTVGQVATGNGRSAVLIELNAEYLELARQRIGPMLCRQEAV